MKNVPNLKVLVLTANDFKELADLDMLSGFGRLMMLSLMENPVARKEVRLPCGSMRGIGTGKGLTGRNSTTDIG